VTDTKSLAKSLALDIKSLGLALALRVVDLTSCLYIYVYHVSK